MGLASTPNNKQESFLIINGGDPEVLNMIGVTEMPGIPRSTLPVWAGKATGANLSK
jgi:hypothetical protein